MARPAAVRLALTGGRRAYRARLRAALGAALVQYLPAGETTGAAAADRSGNANPGAYAGTCTLGAAGPGLPGDNGKAVDLARTGAVNAYSAGLAARFNGGAGLAAAWFAASSPEVWRDGGGLYVLGFGADANNQLFLRVLGSGEAATLQFYYLAGGAGTNININQIPTARWVHLAVCWDAAGDQIGLYINGALQPTAGSLGSWSGGLASNFAYFGATQGRAQPFAGKMAHCVYAEAAASAAALRGLADQARGVVCFEGDSRTAQQAWPFRAVEAAYPGGARAFGGYGVTCLASSGANHIVINARAAEVDARRVPGGKNVLVHWAGVNHGALGPGIYANQLAYLSARKAAGWKVVWCSEIDASPAGWHTSYWPALNAALRANPAAADVVVDLGADARLQDYTNPTYFSDGIHLTAAGYAVVESLVAAGLAAV